MKETPAPDYYDEVNVNGTIYKVGIKIDGDDLFKHNVTQMLQEMKKLTPERYKELIPYAPKRIMRSPDNFNWYGGAPDDDVIKLSKGSEIMGGGDDIDMVKNGLSGLEPELRNAMRSKTGVHFNSTYESELNANKGKAEYNVELGLWTEEQANKYLEIISGRLKNGTYFNGAAGINVTDANKKAAEGR